MHFKTLFQRTTGMGRDCWVGLHVAWLLLRLGFISSSRSSWCRKCRSGVLRLIAHHFHEGAYARCFIFLEPFVCRDKVRNAVEPKGAETLPEYAPIGEYPTIAEAPDCERVEPRLGVILPN